MYGLLDDPENLENRKMYCMYLKEKEFGAGEKKKKQMFKNPAAIVAVRSAIYREKPLPLIRLLKIAELFVGFSWIFQLVARQYRNVIAHPHLKLVCFVLFCYDWKDRDSFCVICPLRVCYYITVVSRNCYGFNGYIFSPEYSKYHNITISFTVHVLLVCECVQGKRR